MKFRMIALAGVAALALSTPAMANEGWYLGLGAGWNQQLGTKVTSIGSPATGTLGKTDKSDSVIVAGSIGYVWDSGLRLENEIAWMKSASTKTANSYVIALGANILALSGVWTVLLPALVAAKFRRLKVTAITLMLLPIYYLLVSAATWMAVLDLFLRPHYWAKTAHGRSQQAPNPLVRQAQPST